MEEVLNANGSCGTAISHCGIFEESENLIGIWKK
jgi:hypothetical protein